MNRIGMVKAYFRELNFVVLSSHNLGQFSAFRIFSSGELKAAVAWIIAMVNDLAKHKSI